MARRRTAPQALPAGCRQGWWHRPGIKGSGTSARPGPELPFNTGMISGNADARQCGHHGDDAWRAAGPVPRAKAGKNSDHQDAPSVARYTGCRAPCPTYSNRNAPAKRPADISAQAISPAAVPEEPTIHALMYQPKSTPEQDDKDAAIHNHEKAMMGAIAGISAKRSRDRSARRPERMRAKPATKLTAITL